METIFFQKHKNLLRMKCNVYNSNIILKQRNKYYIYYALFQNIRQIENKTKQLKMKMHAI